MPTRLPRRSRRTTLLLLIACLAFPGMAMAQERDSAVGETVESWYRSALRRAPGNWGIVVADASGRPIWASRAEEPFVPASTVKLFTTGFARATLGGEARRATRVLGVGRLDGWNGAWVGSWRLELNGDPSLDRPGGGGPTLTELALQLGSNGVARLSGPLVLASQDAEPGAWYPEAWASRHRGRLFAPPVGPLSIHENVVRFSVSPGARNGQPAVLASVSPAGLERLVTVKARTVAGRRSRLALRADGQGGWVVSGTIGVRASARGMSAVAYEPRAVVEAAWARALELAGIEWDRAAMPTGSSFEAGVPLELARVESPPLDSLASDVNTRSHNLGAELLLLWAGGANRPADRLSDHVRQVAGSQHAVHLVDGSGLSNDDRVAPMAFTAYLANILDVAGRDFPMLLPANGTGTLRQLRRGLPDRGVVRAKTGTLANVSTVVGYLGRSDGVLLISLLYNGRHSYQARAEQWRLFQQLGADGVLVRDAFAEPETQLGGTPVE